MKDLKVYDGAGWQSLKGPPGPSAVSSDRGNRLDIGTDGLVRFIDGTGALDLGIEYGEFVPKLRGVDLNVGDYFEVEPLGPALGSYIAIGGTVVMSLVAEINVPELASTYNLDIDQTEAFGMNIPFSSEATGGGTVHGSAIGTAKGMMASDVYGGQYMIVSIPGTEFSDGFLRWADIRGGFIQATLIYTREFYRDGGN